MVAEENEFIFVSYAHEDSDFADQLVQDLRGKGINCWVDTEGLKPGEPNWVRAIEQAIDQCSAMIVLCSPKAVESDWVYIEINRAQGRGKPIYPILVAGDSLTSIPMSISGIQYISVEPDGYEVFFLRLVDIVTTVVDKKSVSLPMPGESERPPTERKPATQKMPAVKPAPSLPADAKPRPGATSTDHEFVFVPEGVFEMGTDSPVPDDRFDQKPQHNVTLRSYYIGKYCVSVKQYKDFVDSTGYVTKAERDGYGRNLKNLIQDGASWRTPLDGTTEAEPDFPVTTLSYEDMYAYCEWLSQFLPGMTATLPTEAQWEKAAKGGDVIPQITVFDAHTYTVRGGIDPTPSRDVINSLQLMPRPNLSLPVFPWGDESPQGRANYEAGSFVPVQQYEYQSKSPYGCVQMAGNVWEACSDLYDSSYYRYSPKANPTGPERGALYVIRGGNFRSKESELRVTYRDKADDYHPIIGRGFRIVLNAE